MVVFFFHLYSTDYFRPMPNACFHRANTTPHSATRTGTQRDAAAVISSRSVSQMHAYATAPHKHIELCCRASVMNTKRNVCTIFSSHQYGQQTYVERETQSPQNEQKNDINRKPSGSQAESYSLRMKSIRDSISM